MNCPFCFVNLNSANSKFHEEFFCDNKECVSHKMPRFKATYTKYPYTLISRSFILGQYYIQQDFITTQTTISKLNIVFIDNHITVPFIIPVDLIDPKKEEERLKNLLVFS